MNGVMHKTDSYVEAKRFAAALHESGHTVIIKNIVNGMKVVYANLQVS